MATDTKLDSLVINYLTQSQYDTAKTNGKLNANQIYMTPASNTSYTLPTATSSTLGGVKIGNNITVSSGTISLTKANVTNSLMDGRGNVILGENSIDTVSAGAGADYGPSHSLIVGTGNKVTGLKGGNNYVTTYYDGLNSGFVGGNYCVSTYAILSNNSPTSNVLIFGNGTSSAKSNSFRIDYGGKAYGGTYSSSGADYAEMFEWQDGNPDGEDRRGMFVTLDGKYIRLANSKDTYILGIVSGNPTVLGDTAEDQWAGMYERDIFGALKHDSTTENGLVLNPNYDNDKQYIARGQRKEWDAVGLMGKLVVVDDGTCEVNGFCAANDNGIGTNAETGYRVMERLDENHIRVFVK